jgi:hypothetical protein
MAKTLSEFGKAGGPGAPGPERGLGTHSFLRKPFARARSSTRGLHHLARGSR